MIRIDIKRTSFYSELTEEEQKKYFTHKRACFSPHVDTLYYNVFLEGDDKDSPKNFGIDRFIEFCQYGKSLVQQENDDVWLDTDKDILFKRGRFRNYEFRISKTGYFDIFICSKLPNNSTPRIHVQLRSIGLWTLGEYESVIDSYKYLKELLEGFGVNIKKVKENRLDYCYHTNAIQSPFKFYSDLNLKKHLKSNLTKYNKIGDIVPGSITVDYLSLGKRQSNNVFFRSYNKVKEVIEENYKEFFIEYWYNMGMISFYDFKVYSYAYKYKNYDYIYKGMLQFYVDYGRDKFKQDCFKSLLSDVNTTLKTIKEYALKYLPLPTLIINIEYQTQRKFYYNGDSMIDLLPISHELDEPPLLRIFQILDNRKLFLDYLTSTTVSFVKNNSTGSEIEYLDFWKRLRSCKLDKNVILDYKRVYSKNLNYELLVSKLKGTLASLALYKGQDDTDLSEDLSLLMGIFNDNDIKVMEDGTFTVNDDEYIYKKEKRKKALKSILKSMDSSRPSNK